MAIWTVLELGQRIFYHRIRLGRLLRLVYVIHVKRATTIPWSIFRSSIGVEVGMWRSTYDLVVENGKMCWVRYLIHFFPVMDTGKYGSKPLGDDHTDTFCRARMIGSDVCVRSFRRFIPFVNNCYNVLVSHFYRSTPSPPSTFVLFVVTRNMIRKPAISRAYRVAWRCTMMMNCNRLCIVFYNYRM